MLISWKSLQALKDFADHEAKMRETTPDYMDAALKEASAALSRKRRDAR